MFRKVKQWTENEMSEELTQHAAAKTCLGTHSCEATCCSWKKYEHKFSAPGTHHLVKSHVQTSEFLHTTAGLQTCTFNHSTKKKIKIAALFAFLRQKHWLTVGAAASHKLYICLEGNSRQMGQQWTLHRHGKNYCWVKSRSSFFIVWWC